MARTKEQNREYQRQYRARKAAERAEESAGEGEKDPKESRVHRDAVSRQLRATGLLHVPEEAPLVQLVKALAKEMDLAPSASTSSRYRVAIADVRRVLNASPGRPKASSDPKPPAEEEPTESAEKVSVLADFKAARGIA